MSKEDYFCNIFCDVNIQHKIVVLIPFPVHSFPKFEIVFFSLAWKTSLTMCPSFTLRLVAEMENFLELPAPRLFSVIRWTLVRIHAWDMCSQSQERERSNCCFSINEHTRFQVEFCLWLSPFSKLLYGIPVESLSRSNAAFTFPRRPCKKPYSTTDLSDHARWPTNCWGCVCERKGGGPSISHNGVRKTVLDSFHLNSRALWCHPQTHNLAPPCKV